MIIIEFNFPQELYSVWFQKCHQHLGCVTNIPKLSPIGSVSLLLDRCIHSLFIRVFNSEKSFVELTFGCFKLNYTFWFRSKSISQNHFQSCIFGSAVKYYEKSWLFAISWEFQGFNDFFADITLLTPTEESVI